MAKKSTTVFTAVAILFLIGTAMYFVGRYLGTYGPFEVTVASIDGQELENVVVYVAFIGITAHGTASTYKQYRVGRTNEPIVFPRGFICFCLEKPTLSVATYHPFWLGGDSKLSTDNMTRSGTVSFEVAKYRTWDDRMRERADRFSEFPPESPAVLRLYPEENAKRFRAHLRRMRETYSRHVSFIGKQDAAISYKAELLRQLEVAPMPDNFLRAHRQEIERITNRWID